MPYDYSQSQAILGIGGEGGGGSPIPEGEFIRNQGPTGQTPDEPGNILLGNSGGIRMGSGSGYPFRVVLTDGSAYAAFRAIDTNSPNKDLELRSGEVFIQDDLGSVTFKGGSAVVVESVPEHFYDFLGNWQVKRLKFLLSEIDTIKAELVNKLVDSDGVSFPLVDSVTYGKQLKIPTAILAGTPNAQSLFEYSLCESVNTIAADGSSAGNSRATRAFAFISDSSRKMTKMRIFIGQTGGTVLRLGIYDASGNILGKTNLFPVVNGIVSANLITPVSLVGGVMYYMAYYTDDTSGNVRFGTLSGRSTSSASPLFQRVDIANDFPNNIASAGANTQFRPWLMVSE